MNVETAQPLFAGEVWEAEGWFSFEFHGEDGRRIRDVVTDVLHPLRDGYDIRDVGCRAERMGDFNEPPDSLWSRTFLGFDADGWMSESFAGCA